MVATPCRAFTLIELLVVITIIVVIVGLMAPAMDQAVYQAELVGCGARLDPLGSGVTTYAFDFNRRYPYRPSVAAERASQMRQLNDILVNYEEREILRGRISLKLLQCPLSPQLDLDSFTATASIVPVLHASYDLWYGWAYEKSAGMTKLGDRWAWDNRPYSIVASDFNLFHISNRTIVSSHPDSDGKLARIIRPNYADWRTENIELQRGTIDQNYLYADGSVVRYARVRMLNEDGDRAAVPWASHNGGVQPAGWQLWVAIQ